MIRLIRHHRWEKILFKKTSGRLVGLVLQRAVPSMWVLEIKQHQRYNRIKWNFGMDNNIDSALGGGGDSGGGNAVGGVGCCCYNGNTTTTTTTTTTKHGGEDDGCDCDCKPRTPPSLSSSFLATKRGVQTRTKHHCGSLIARNDNDNNSNDLVRAPKELAARLGWITACLARLESIVCQVLYLVDNPMPVPMPVRRTTENNRGSSSSNDGSNGSSHHHPGGDTATTTTTNRYNTTNNAPW